MDDNRDSDTCSVEALRQAFLSQQDAGGQESVKPSRLVLQHSHHDTGTAALSDDGLELCWRYIWWAPDQEPVTSDFPVPCHSGIWYYEVDMLEVRDDPFFVR